MGSSWERVSRLPCSPVSQRTSAAGRPRSAMQVATTVWFPPSSRGAEPAGTYTLGYTREGRGREGGKDKGGREERRREGGEEGDGREGREGGEGRQTENKLQNEY